MLAGELRAMFAKMASRNVSDTLEVADELMAAGQPLPVLVVAAQWCECPQLDHRVAEAVSAIEAKIAAGELDPVAAGSVAWGFMSGDAICQYLNTQSLMWLGIPDGVSAFPATASRPAD